MTSKYIKVFANTKAGGTSRTRETKENEPRALMIEKYTNMRFN